MRKVDFAFFDAGGGHRSAANALKTVARQEGREWSVWLVNIQEVLDDLDIFRKYTGVRLQDVYNRMLASGVTLGSEYLLPAMQGLIRLYHPAQVRMLAAHWSEHRPDMLVSLVPNLNRAMYQAIQRVDPRIPYVTVITDFADYPPHFWMEKQDQYMICGTPKALEQARKIGYKPEKTFLTSGMILRPAFYDDVTVDRTAERAKLGLDPALPTGVVLFGGHGSGKIEEIARAAQGCKRDLQLILMCGRNEKLAGDLRSLNTRFPTHIVCFTEDVPAYMRVADFFIGKPGPGSISEAIAMHLPVIIERNSWTLPQERYNAEWVREKHVGMVVNNFRDIASAIDRLLEPATLAEYKANAGRIRNRAVFEVLDILDRIVAETRN
jgi:1,2-diacylglycerol 3-beta-galactosyltransferase